MHRDPGAAGRENLGIAGVPYLTTRGPTPGNRSVPERDHGHLSSTDKAPKIFSGPDICLRGPALRAA